MITVLLCKQTFNVIIIVNVTYATVIYVTCKLQLFANKSIFILNIFQHAVISYFPILLLTYVYLYNHISIESIVIYLTIYFIQGWQHAIGYVYTLRLILLEIQFNYNSLIFMYIVLYYLCTLIINIVFLEYLTYKSLYINLNYN